MSLIDADKDNVQRKAPKINAPDTVLNRMAHKTNQTTYRESGSSVVSRFVFMQAGIMTIDEGGKVNSIWMYLPEVSPIPIFGIMKDGFDVFEDGFEGTVERPRV